MKKWLPVQKIIWNLFFYLFIVFSTKKSSRKISLRVSPVTKKTNKTCFFIYCTKASSVDWSSKQGSHNELTRASSFSIPIAPPQVDSSKGPPGCTCAGGQFRPNLNIQAIKKIIDRLENVGNSVGNQLHPFFTFFEWLDAIFKITPRFQPPHLF